MKMLKSFQKRSQRKLVNAKRFSVTDNNGASGFGQRRSNDKYSTKSQIKQSKKRGAMPINNIGEGACDAIVENEKWYRQLRQKNVYKALTEALRISAYLFIIPLLLISYFLYNHPDTELWHYFATVFVLLLLVVVSIYPFVRDGLELIEYLKNLLFRSDVSMPLFNSFTAASQMPNVMAMLKKSWEDTHRELSSKIVEGRILFNTIPNIILTLNHNLVVINANDTAHNVLGANLVGHNIASLIDDQNLTSMIILALHEKIGKSLELKLNDIIPRYYEVKIALFNSEKHKLHHNVLLVFNDITEIKRIEQTFNDFIASASHEMRTPITAIMGISETLLKAGYDDREAFDYFMPMIKLHSESMAQLLKDLFNLMAIEKHLTEPPRDLVNMAQIIKFSAGQLAWELSQNENTIVLPDNDMPEIIGDKSQLTQVFYNLITNAIKYGKQGEKIILQAAVTHIFPKLSRSVVGYEKMLAISVQDFGKGITQENIGRLTEVFFRVDKSRSKKIKGTGLGLTIVKKIIIRHNGFLDIKSTPNQGSTFTVYFPVYDNVISSENA